MGLSLSGFNNHSGLQNNQQGLDAALPSGILMQGGNGFSARAQPSEGDGSPNPDGCLGGHVNLTQGLDHAHSQFGLIQAEVFGDNHCYMAQALVHARIVYDLSIIHDNLEALSDKLDELTNNLDAHIEANRDAALTKWRLTHNPEAVADQIPAWVGPWQASTQLMDLLNPLVCRLLLSPTIQGYTARFDSTGVWLVNSLFNTAKQTVNQQGPAWTAQHLPSNTNGLLTGIWEPKAGEVVDTSIPTLKDLLYQQGITMTLNLCGKRTDDPTRARLAYLRREAVRIYQLGRGSSLIWACANWQLDKLSGPDPNHAVAIYHLVYRDDHNIFQSGVMWQNIKNNVDFALPDEEAIQAAMQQADPPMDSQAQH
ncbi:hypothetical protein DFH28DRAFT_1217712 [Melampsora americana]|nr:hypothetical protein DFH28DRAFT_1217712 [Melampsora americana]